MATAYVCKAIIYNSTYIIIYILCIFCTMLLYYYYVSGILAHVVLIRTFHRVCPNGRKKLYPPPPPFKYKLVIITRMQLDPHRR